MSTSNQTRQFQTHSKNHVNIKTVSGPVPVAQKRAQNNVQNNYVKGHRIKQRSLLNSIYHCFAEYSENTSIHGLKFITEAKRPWIERVCWIVALLVSLYICFALIWSIYQKWISLPVIITFATSPTSVFNIPFPAITVCPTVKSYRDLFNYTDLYLKKRAGGDLMKNETEHFEYMSLICNSGSRLLQLNETRFGEDVINYMMEVAPPFEDYASGTWKGEDISDNLTNYFSPILTSEGLCYTFNMIDGAELYSELVHYPGKLFSTHGKKSTWFPEQGYKIQNKTEHAYPRRTSFAGVSGGFRLGFFLFKSEIDYVCSGSLQGYRVTLHEPMEFPLIEQNYFHVPLGQSVMVAVRPSQMTTSKELESYKPQERNCYFTYERKLAYFKNYNQQNCLIECLTNFTLNKCQCVSFQMPKEHDTPICGSRMKICVEKAKRSFYATEVHYDDEKERLGITNTKYTNQCDCLPACYSMSYDIVLSPTDIKAKETFLALSDNLEERGLFENEEIILSELYVFFKDVQFLPSERNQLYGSSEFWANVGGIMGLFTGFSFVSLCEIFYYLILRIICNVKMYGRQYWYGPPELVEVRNISYKRYISGLKER